MPKEKEGKSGEGTKERRRNERASTMSSWADLPIAHSKEMYHQSQLSPDLCQVVINSFRGSSECQDDQLLYL